MPAQARNTSALAALPLFLAYLAWPLWQAVSPGLGLAKALAHVPSPMDGLWLALAALAVLASLFPPRRAAEPAPAERPAGRAGLEHTLVMAGLLLLLVAALYRFGGPLLDLTRNKGPYVLELRPFVYLLFAGLWVLSFGLPGKRTFVRLGAMLGALVALDFLVGLARTGYILPAERFGGGQYQSTLLLASLCAGLRQTVGHPAADPEDRECSPFSRFCIVAGLFASLSHSALFAMGWIVLFFGRWKLPTRVLVAAACAAAIAFTLLRSQAPMIDLENLNRSWLWVAGLDLFLNEPLRLLTGFPVDAPLPVAVPQALQQLWGLQSHTMDLFGVHPYNIEPFWLRFCLVWGLGPAVAFLGTSLVLLLRNLSCFGAGLVAAILAQGMASELFYRGNLAVVLCLALFLALGAPRPKDAPEARTSTPPPEAKPEEPPTGPMPAA